MAVVACWSCPILAWLVIVAGCLLGGLYTRVGNLAIDASDRLAVHALHQLLTMSLNEPKSAGLGGQNSTFPAALYKHYLTHSWELRGAMTALGYKSDSGQIPTTSVYSLRLYQLYYT